MSQQLEYLRKSLEKMLTVVMDYEDFDSLTLHAEDMANTSYLAQNDCDRAFTPHRVNSL